MLRECGALDSDDPIALRFKSQVLTFAAAYDDLQRRLGRFGRLQFRWISWRHDLIDRLRGWRPASRCTHWPVKHELRCPVR
jgi:hypothetical protein